MKSDLYKEFMYAEQTDEKAYMCRNHNMSVNETK